MDTTLNILADFYKEKTILCLFGKHKYDTLKIVTKRKNRIPYLVCSRCKKSARQTWPMYAEQ